MTRIALILCVFAAGATVWFFQPQSQHILVHNAVAAPFDDGSGQMRVYFRIENSGEPDLLTGATSSKGQAMLYSPESDSGIPIPSASTPSLAVDGAHIIISLLNQEVKTGQLIPLTLDFANAGAVRTKVRMVGDMAASQSSLPSLFGYGGICVVGDGEPAPAIELQATASDDNGWTINVLSEEFEFREDLIDYPHVPGMGHGHIYVGGIKIARLLNPTFEIGALPKGKHTIRVTLSTNDHRAYVVENEPVSATVTVDVN